MKKETEFNHSTPIEYHLLLNFFFLFGRFFNIKTESTRLISRRCCEAARKKTQRKRRSEARAENCASGCGADREQMYTEHHHDFIISAVVVASFFIPLFVTHSI